MSVGAKVGLVAFVVVVALGAGGFYWWQQRDRAPSEKMVRMEVEKAIGNPLLKIAEITPTITPAGTGAADIQFHAVAELGEPLYEQMDAAGVLRDDLKLDLDAWQKAQQTVAGPDAARILDLAGLKGMDDTLLQTTFLHEVSAKGLKVPFDGKLRATKTGNDWHLELQPGAPPISTPPGQPRASFAGHTAVPGIPAEMAKLRDLAAKQSDVPAKIEQARIALDEERKANEKRVMEKLAADLAPGTLFAGTATTGSGTPDHLFLEITALDADGKQITAVLRNEGGWSDARAFKGTFAPGPDHQTMTVTLATQRSQAVRKAGPFLDRNESWQIVFSFSDGKLTGHSGEWDYSFTRLADSEATAARNGLDADAGALRAATAPGKVYRGSVHAKSGADTFEYLLRFNRQDDNGAVLGLTLEAPGHGAWQRAFRGAIIGNKFKAEGWPLHLETRASDGVKAATGNPLLAAREGFAVNFKLADGRLVGESKDFTWDFGVFAGNEVAKVDTDPAELKKQFFAVVKTGASFTGRARSASADQPERVRVRFTLVDLRNGTIEALVESLETSGVSREFRGSPDLTEGRLELTSDGSVRGRPGKAVHCPVFLDSNSDMVISFSVADEKLAGELKSTDWTLEF